MNSMATRKCTQQDILQVLQSLEEVVISSTPTLCQTIIVTPPIVIPSINAT